MMTRHTMSPITSGVKITEVQALLLSKLNVSCRTRDLPCYEGSPSSWTLMIEQDAIASIHSVSFSVIYSNPV